MNLLQTLQRINPFQRPRPENRKTAAEALQMLGLTFPSETTYPVEKVEIMLNSNYWHIRSWIASCPNAKLTERQFQNHFSEPYPVFRPILEQGRRHGYTPSPKMVNELFQEGDANKIQELLKHYISSVKTENFDSLSKYKIGSKHHSLWLKFCPTVPLSVFEDITKRVGELKLENDSSFSYATSNPNYAASREAITEALKYQHQNDTFLFNNIDRFSSRFERAKLAQQFPSPSAKKPAL